MADFPCIPQSAFLGFPVIVLLPVLLSPVLQRVSSSFPKRSFRRQKVSGSAFSDQKSRGFHLDKSHIADQHRLSRLLIAACLAYTWIIYLGALCIEQGWTSIIHRRHRCDLSLFQLGLRLLNHFLNEDRRIPVAFQVSI